MNELIKELSKRAFEYADHYDRIGVDCTFQHIFEEKFAELIVRECAQVAKDPAPSVYDNDSYKLGRKFAGIDVLNHFGVK